MAEVDPDAGYLFEFIPSDIGNRFRPPFEAIDAEQPDSDSDEELDAIALAHFRLNSRGRYLLKLNQQNKSKFRAANDLMLASPVRMQVIAHFAEAEALIDKVTVDLIDFIAAVKEKRAIYAQRPEQEVLDWYEEFFQTAVSIFPNIFRSRAAILKADMIRQTLECNLIARQLNSTNSDPEYIIPTLKSQLAFGINSLRVAKELDQKLILVYQWRKAVVKKISSLQRKLFPYKANQQVKEFLERIDAMIADLRQRFGLIDVWIKRLNDIKINRLDLLESLEFVARTYFLMFNFYTELVKIDIENKNMREAGPGETHPLLIALKEVIEERRRRPTYSQVVKSSIPDQLPPSIFPELRTSKNHRQHGYRRPTRFTSKKSARRRQAEEDWEEPYPPYPPHFR